MDFESNEKNMVLKFYPEAICHSTLENHRRSGRWQIMDGEKIISTSFQNEATAWNWALLKANQELIDKLSS